MGIVIGYVNKILLLPNFFSETQVGLVNILVSFSVIYAQFSALGINFTIVKFFPFFRSSNWKNLPENRKNPCRGIDFSEKRFILDTVI